MFGSSIAAMMQVAPPATVPPPPIVPVVIWAEQAGRAEKVHLVLLAPTTDAPMSAPDTFHERLRIGGRTIPVLLHRDGPPVSVPIGGYLKATYSFALPRDATGDALLITDLSDVGGFLIQVSG